MQHTKALLLSTAYLICAAAASGQPTESGQFKQAQPLDSGLAPQVINGQPVDPSAWPATRVSSTKTAAGTFNCTATIIGPQVVLTAAHCVDDNAVMSIHTASGPQNVTCNHHGDYREASNYRNDIALCLATRPLALPPSERYERLNTDPTVPRRGQKIRLVGYGCRTPGGDLSGYLVAGPATVDTKELNRIKAAAGATLCEGDSGGAAYIENGPQRVIVGVNSTRATDYSYSNVTNLAAPEIASFVAEWLDEKGAVACGHNAPSHICRN